LKPKPAGVVPQKPKRDDSEQSKRFVDSAKEIQADETGEAFRRALEKIVSPTKPVR